MDYSLPGSSVHGILQARTLDWVAIPFSRRASLSRDRTCVSCIFLKYLYLFIYLAAPGHSCSIQTLSWSMWDLVSQTRSNLGPLHWECTVLANGSPGKSFHFIFLTKNCMYLKWTTWFDIHTHRNDYQNQANEQVFSSLGLHFLNMWWNYKVGLPWWPRHTRLKSRAHYYYILGMLHHDLSSLTRDQTCATYSVEA